MKTHIPLIFLMLAGTVALAGPPLGCVDFSPEPGSLFERVAPLARIMIESDDSPQKGESAAAKIRLLREKADQAPDNFVAQVEAGYLIAAINQMMGRKDADGLPFLQRALALQPENAELHLILALAYRGRDEDKVRLHIASARRYMKKGSAAEKNFLRAKTHLGIS